MDQVSDQLYVCVHAGCKIRPNTSLSHDQLKEHDEQGHEIQKMRTVIELLNSQGIDKFDKKQYNRQIEDEIQQYAEMIMKQIKKYLKKYIEELEEQELTREDQLIQTLVQFYEKDPMSLLQEEINDFCSTEEDFSLFSFANIMKYKEDLEKYAQDYKTEYQEGLIGSFTKTKKTLTIKDKDSFANGLNKSIPSNIHYDKLAVGLTHQTCDDLSAFKEIGIHKYLEEVKFQVEWNAVSDLSFITGFLDLKRLRSLRLTLMGNKIQDISILENLNNFKNLKDLGLDLSFNQITDISSLRQGLKIPTLEELNVSVAGNPVSDISALDVIGSLNRLIKLQVKITKMDQTNIDFLESFGQLHHLRTFSLSASDNKLIDVTPLKQLKKCGDLNYILLYLRGNQIEKEQLQFLKEFKGLLDVKTLLIQFNKQYDQELVTELEQHFQSDIHIVKEYMQLSQQEIQVFK